MPLRNDYLESRSQPVREIIGREPNWIVRWGITVVFITVGFLLLATWIIKYPEIITTRITITTSNPPIKVVSRTSGKIVSFFVGENDTVDAGQTLALLENTARYEDIGALARRLEEFQGFMLEPLAYLELSWNKNAALGDLQPAYTHFLRDFFNFTAFAGEDSYRQRMAAISAQIRNYRKLNQKLESQVQILNRELELALKTYQKNQRLRERDLISEDDLASVESQFLQKKFGLERAESSIIENQIQLEHLRRELLEIQQRERDDQRQLLIDAQSSYKTLVSELSSWEQLYLLKSPARGRISFFKFWSDNQYVREGEEVMTVVPELNPLVGRISIPQRGSGKVVRGQTVNIKLDSYPHREYGMVKGVVDSISPVARQEGYLINVSLPEGLTTHYGKALEFKYQMQGTAVIVTRDMRLIERIFNQFRYLITSST